MICGNKSALIGGQFANWKLKGEPAKEDFEFIDQFFDRDSPTPEDIKGQGNEIVNQTGKLKLVNFKEFINFLIQLSYPINELL
jgi:hypothetical protein